MATKSGHELEEAATGTETKDWNSWDPLNTGQLAAADA